MSIAYLAARALAETMAMVMRDIKTLPEREHAAVRLAHDAAYTALLNLSSIVDDGGNAVRPLVPKG